MKKLVIAIIAATLSLGAIASSKAVEIAGHMSGTWSAQNSTNGKKFAATWSASGSYYVSMNGSGNDSGWGVPIILSSPAPIIGSDVEVLANGTIVVVYIDLEGDIYYRTSSNANSLADPVQLPNSNAFIFNVIDVESHSNKVTIAATAENNGVMGAYSWTSNSDFSNWSLETISSDLYPVSYFPECVNPLNCYHPATITISQNAKSQQLVFVEAELMEDDVNKFVWYAGQRKTSASNWQELQALDSWGPASKNSWGNTSPSLVVTENGKAAIAFVNSIGSDSLNNGDVTSKVEVFSSAKYNKPFIRKDVNALESEWGVQQPFLIKLGEKVYLAYQEWLEDVITSEDDPTAIYYGEVGKLNKAKKVFKSTSHTLTGMVVVKGVPNLFTTKVDNDLEIGYVTKLKNKKWGTPTVAWTPDDGRSLFGWFTSCSSSAKVAVCTASTDSSADWTGDIRGIEAKIFK